MTALLVGLGLGVLVAAQVGPVTLLCLRTVLRHGARPGWGIAAGVALVDTAYAALGVLGAASLLAAAPVRLAAGLVGAAVLVVLGVRTIWSATRVRAGLEDDSEVLAPGAAFRTAVLATASNPLTVLSWAALFAAASTAEVVEGRSAAFALVAGVAAGSLAWYVALVAVTAVVRRRVGPRVVQVADVLSGSGLVGFGGLLAVRSLRDA